MYNSMVNNKLRTNTNYQTIIDYYFENANKCIFPAVNTQYFYLMLNNLFPNNKSESKSNC